MMRDAYDLVVVGGGVNGCGIARDAAGRGLSVLLLEQADLASGTSSASTKLIHGGLRYLEQFAFRLVRESLIERETLLSLAPHIIYPMRFVLPHVAGMRPAWLIRCGLFLYDHLAARAASLPPCRKIDLGAETRGTPLAGIQKGVAFEYADCWVDDARLVVLNAQDAARRGADVCTRARCAAATADGDGWRVQLRQNGGNLEVAARCLVNATGPWVGQFLTQLPPPDEAARATRPSLRLVQGSHIVVPALYEGEHAYLLQNPDGRVVFTIPYEGQWTLIGTTDRDYDGDPRNASASDEEVEYLRQTIARYFGKAPDSITHHFCGVRPLADGSGGAAQKANRDYLLKLERVDRAPLLNIYGGKLTTYRKLAESALDTLQSAGVFPSAGDAWSATAPLPGGDLPADGINGIITTLRAADKRISEQHALRLARAYGTMAIKMLPDAAADTGAGDNGGAGNNGNGDGGQWRCFGADLHAWEVDYLMQHEWAQQADDVLWRRSTLGLRVSTEQRAQLDSYMRQAGGHA